MERDVPALVGTGSVFHQRGTTDEKSLDWPERTSGRARRCLSEERSGLEVVYVCMRAFK